MEVFGPVQSRRFGMSLGINNLPPKTCSYACVYCQLGRTHPLTIAREVFCHSAEINQAVKSRLDELEQPPDYFTFVSNGEPTLDSNLGEHINELHSFGLPVAVISNASLIWHTDVRSALMKADTVSLKVDAVESAIWREINRTHGKLRLDRILSEILSFAREYKGRLLSESMLVAGINDTQEHIQSLAEFIAAMQPEIAYLALPLRAPAEAWVQPPKQKKLAEILQIFSNIFPRSTIMADLPETGLKDSSEPTKELLRTLKVHPMEEDEILAYLRNNQLSQDALKQLIKQGQIHSSVHKGKTFYTATYKE